MQYMLVIMFFVNGPTQPPAFLDGWLPLIMEDYATCEERREFVEEQFKTISNNMPPYTLACYERQVPGEML